MIISSALKLPVLDLAQADPHALASHFRAAGQTHGFMLLTGHGVPPELFDSAFEYARRFFELPLEEKLELKRDLTTGKGYMVFGSQTLEGSLDDKGHEGAHMTRKTASKQISDQKEGFSLGPNAGPEHPRWGQYGIGPNKLPPEDRLPGLGEFADEYSACMLSLQKRLMDIVAISLDLDPETSFAGEVVRDPMIAWRLLHYPPAGEPDTTGAGAHTDFGILTILATDGQPGLQVYYQGEWHPVAPRKGDFVVNIGDCLAIISGYKSSLHRVINNVGTKSRYSIPCFCDGSPELVVKPLSKAEEDDADFPTMSQYLAKRLAGAKTPGV